jgi:hypothetical protein
MDFPAACAPKSSAQPDLGGYFQAKAMSEKEPPVQQAGPIDSVSDAG